MTSDLPPESHPLCRRCGRPVVLNAPYYQVFEGMHYVCFHYEFEHPGDPDEECQAGGCPAAGTRVPSLLIRTDGVDIAQAGNTVVPAILALQQLGFLVKRDGESLVASLGQSRMRADDPVALLGLVKLVEVRTPWRVSDCEIEDITQRYDL